LSGGPLSNDQGEYFGDQSVHGEPLHTNNGSPDDLSSDSGVTYDAVRMKNPATTNYQIVIGFAVAAPTQ
jgi:hypothetical protein